MRLALLHVNFESEMLSFISGGLVGTCRGLFPQMSHRREDTFVAGLSMGSYHACGAEDSLLENARKTRYFFQSLPQNPFGYVYEEGPGAHIRRFLEFVMPEGDAQ